MKQRNDELMCMFGAAGFVIFVLVCVAGFVMFLCGCSHTPKLPQYPPLDPWLPSLTNYVPPALTNMIPKPEPQSVTNSVPTGLVDDVAVNQIRFLKIQEVASWPAKYDLKVSHASKTTINLAQDLTADNTVKNDLTGNAWVGRKIKGEWVMGSFEWMKRGQKVKNARAVAEDHIKDSAFGKGWRAGKGEELIFMVSGLCRGTARPAKDSEKVRTVIRAYKWPYERIEDTTEAGNELAELEMYDFIFNVK